MKPTQSDTKTILIRKIISLDYHYVNSGKAGYPAWCKDADNAVIAAQSEDFSPAHQVIEAAQYALGIC